MKELKKTILLGMRSAIPDDVVRIGFFENNTFKFIDSGNRIVEVDCVNNTIDYSLLTKGICTNLRVDYDFRRQVNNVLLYGWKVLDHDSVVEHHDNRRYDTLGEGGPDQRNITFDEFNDSVLMYRAVPSYD